MPGKRLSANKAFYDSKAWRCLRRVQLASEPLCRDCKTRGRVTQATQVDHIKPITQGGAALDQSNLQSLCASCHSIKTANDTHGTMMKGCDASGIPIDPNHPWNKGGAESS